MLERGHLEAEQAPHPPDLCYWPFHPISQALSNSFFLNSINSVDGIESWCALYFSVTHEEDCSNENKFSETVLIFFFEPIVKYVDF